MTNEGSPRRCGGQGDILSGSLATFLFWFLKQPNIKNPYILASIAASMTLKECAKKVYEAKGRSMISGDILDNLNKTFDDLFNKK